MNANKTVRGRSDAVMLLAIFGFLTVSTAVAERERGNGYVHQVYLAARSFQQTMPDGRVIPMWGFVEDSDGRLSTYCGEQPTVPGPMISVPSETTELRIDLRNDLDVPVSLMIPGLAQTLGATPESFTDTEGRQRVRSFRMETAPHQRGEYAWKNIEPGTYLYHSASHPAVQVQMGLYGGVKKDFAEQIAYGSRPYSRTIRDADVDSNDRYDDDYEEDLPDPYDNEIVLFFSEIDPSLHEAVAQGHYGTAAYPSTINYAPQYFLTNGRAFPDQSPINIGKKGDRVLIRTLNAGLESHVPTLLGMNWREIAEDGNLHPFPKNQYSTLLPAGKTKDFLIDIPEKAADGTQYPLFDRRLRLTNGSETGGGMLTHLKIESRDRDDDRDEADRDEEGELSATSERTTAWRRSRCIKVGDWDDDWED